MSGPIENNNTGGDSMPPVDVPEINPEEVEAIRIDDVEEEDDDEHEDDHDDDDDDDDEEEDFVSALPAPIRKCVDELKLLNDQREKFLEEYLKERAALEQKYQAMMNPLFDQRRQIISGANDAASKDTDEQEANEVPQDFPSGVPEFWTLAMSNIETLEELITERDTEALNFLKDITCQDFENGLGFKLGFHFDPNPFFTNNVLIKTYDVPNLYLLEDEPILKNVSGCEIDWKDAEMCLTHRVVCKKQRNKKGEIRHVKKREKIESFFHWFSPPKLPDLSEMDEEEADAIEEAFDHDYDVAQQFRCHIVPKAVLWFSGEAMSNALEGVFDGDDNLLAGQISQAMAQNTSDSSPFPPPAEGTEEPECKQS